MAEICSLSDFCILSLQSITVKNKMTPDLSIVERLGVLALQSGLYL